MATDKEKNINLNKTQLSKLLRISDPFLMLDKVINIAPSISAQGSKRINKDEWFYKCHFTDLNFCYRTDFTYQTRVYTHFCPKFNVIN